MRAWLDHKGKRDPMKTCEKLPEAEGKASSRTSPDGVRTGLRAVDQQNERAISQEEKRKQSEGCKTKRRSDSRRPRKGAPTPTDQGTHR